ncbi:MAG: NAD(P)H-binding protein [Zetaproteobacteria bacterium]|nr:NAD(P)H-binding protein [Zetaproteobacteria bacterium]
MVNKAAPTVLVTGSTGYLGRALVTQLGYLGATVVSMYRHKLPESSKNVFPVCSNLSSQELLAAPLRGVDVVVHLAWDHRLPTSVEGIGGESGTGEIGQSANVSATSCLLRAMDDLKTPRVIHVGAVGTTWETKDVFMAEKYAVERLILNSRVSQKTILRAAPVFGGGDFSREPFLRAVAKLTKFPGLYPKCGKDVQISPVHLQDLTEAIVAQVFQDQCDPVQIIHLEGPEALGLETAIRWILEAQGRSGRFSVGGTMADWLEKILQKDVVGGHSLSKAADFRAFMSPKYQVELQLEERKGARSLREYIFESVARAKAVAAQTARQVSSV